MLTADRGASGAKASTQRPAKRLRDAEVTIVNMHRLGESFVEKVIDRSFKGGSRRLEGRDGSNCYD